MPKMTREERAARLIEDAAGQLVESDRLSHQVADYLSEIDGPEAA